MWRNIQRKIIHKLSVSFSALKIFHNDVTICLASIIIERQSAGSRGRTAGSAFAQRPHHCCPISPGCILDKRLAYDVK